MGAPRVGAPRVGTPRPGPDGTGGRGAGVSGGFSPARRTRVERIAPRSAPPARGSGAPFPPRPEHPRAVSRWGGMRGFFSHGQAGEDARRGLDSPADAGPFPGRAGDSRRLPGSGPESDALRSPPRRGRPGGGSGKRTPRQTRRRTRMRTMMRTRSTRSSGGPGARPLLWRRLRRPLSGGFSRRSRCCWRRRSRLPFPPPPSFARWRKTGAPPDSASSCAGSPAGSRCSPSPRTRTTRTTGSTRC